MTIKVVQWGTGTAGLRALRTILGNPNMELVGLYVARGRTGRAVTQAPFLERPDTGIKATNYPAELLELGADCLVYMGSHYPGGVEPILPFLRAGTNVVTAGLGQLQTVPDAPAADRDAVLSACREGNSSFFLHWGIARIFTDLFPMTMLGIVDEVSEIRVQEISNYSTYPVVDLARSFGFGAKPGDPIPLYESNWLMDTWQAVPREIARRLGVEIEEIRIVKEASPTNRDVEAAFYTIKAGEIANLRFQVQGLVKENPS